MVFVRNSVAVTCFLLIESLLVGAISTCERAPYSWIENLIQLIRRKQFGFIFLERVEDQENHDENILIEPKEEEDVAKSSTVTDLWRNLSSILDKVAMFIIVFIYLIMVLTLLPLRYTITNSSDIEVAS